MASVVLAAASFIAGCDAHPPPIAPEAPQSENAIVLERQAPPDATPHVVRRLVAEAQEQMEKNRQMAAELPDPRGRARAQQAVDEVASELASLASRVDDANSDNLDDVMAKLQLLNGRIDDLHDRLRVATERTTAVAE